MKCEAIEPVPTVVAATEWLGFKLNTCIACNRLFFSKQVDPFLLNGHGRRNDKAETIMRLVIERWRPKTRGGRKSMYDIPLATRFVDNAHGMPVMGNRDFMSKQLKDGTIDCSRRSLSIYLRELEKAGMLDIRLVRARNCDGICRSTRYVAPRVLTMAKVYAGLGSDPFPMLEEETYAAMHPCEAYPSPLEWRKAFDLYAASGATEDFNTWLRSNFQNMSERLCAVRQAMADELGVRIDVTKPFSACITKGRWFERASEVHIVEQQQ